MRITILVVIVYIVLHLESKTYPEERAMWVWGMSTDIVLEKHPNDRMDLFSFVAAPHGNQNARISTLFMSIDPYLIEAFPDKVREFIGDAHSRGLIVHFLTGDKEWSFTVNNPNTGEPYNKPALDIITLIKNYNSASGEYEQFDGIQFDIEPYTISSSDRIINPETGTPYVWDNDIAIIWDQYIECLNMLKNKINEPNNDGSINNRLILGAAIPRWYSDNETSVPNHPQIQDIVDYIAIMNYDVRSSAPDGVRTEIEYADLKGYEKSVYVGYETIEVTWRELTEVIDNGVLIDKNYYYNLQTSYWAFGNNELESMIAATENRYGGNPGFLGHAVHYYEDIRNCEYSYRNLGLMKTNHAPVCYVISPCGGETLSGIKKLVYKITDSDNDDVNSEILISTDGIDWFDLFSIIPERDPVMLSDGVYELDISDLPEGNYKIRINALEKYKSLFGFDESDDYFQIAVSKDDVYAPVRSADALVGIVSPVERSDLYSGYGPCSVFVQWDGFIDPEIESDTSGIKGYFYSFSDEVSTAKFTKAKCAYIHSQPGKQTCFVWAVDKSGNISAPLTKPITVYGDIDNDGIIDKADKDVDGDGIPNDEERVCYTDPNRALSYPKKSFLDVYEFDDGNLINSFSSGYNLIRLKGYTPEYPNSGRFYTSDKNLYYGWIYPVPPIHLRINNVLRNKAFSVQMWIKPDNYLNSNNYYVPLVFIGDVNYGISLFLQHRLTKYLQLRIYNGGNSNISKYSGINIPNAQIFDGNWHHVAFSYNRYDKCVKLYIDGKLAGTKRNVFIDESIENLSLIRFFDARSAYDFKYAYYKRLIENSAQLAFIGKAGLNIWNLEEDDENADKNSNNKCRYIGGVDDIRISNHTVYPSELGWYIYPLSSKTDSDCDGISDLKENVFYRTDRLNPDTDGDTLNDGYETNIGTSPDNSDTDNDGLNDGEEKESINTDPLNPDTDGDKMKDGDESSFGSDPFDPQSLFKVISIKNSDSNGVTLIWTDFSGNCENYSVLIDNDGFSAPHNITPIQVDNPQPELIKGNILSWTDTENRNILSKRYKIVYVPED